MKRTWILTGILVLLIAGTIVMAQPSGSGHGGGSAGGGYGAPGDGGGRMPFMDDLTEEQRTALRDMINEMREADATREEIREAVHDQLTEWGIEVPEPGEGRDDRRPPFWDDLTEEQKEALQAMIDEMREADATREEIQTAVHDQLDEWGIELPEPGEGGGGRRPPFWSELTEEQRAELSEMIRGLREADATREEIREAVHNQLTEWGIELPEPGEGRRRPPFWDDLTEEQQEALQTMIDEMREDSATREEIREAVHDQLTEWGIEVPAGPGMGGGHGFGSTPGTGSETPATPSYRNQLRQQIKTSASPSPAKASAEVEYTLEEEAYTTVSVFDSNGRLVKNIYAGNQDAGSHAITWDGKDADGKRLNSGVYLVSIQSGAMAGTQKVILAK